MHQRMTLANAHPSGQRALLHADADARSTDTGARAASAAVLGGHRSGSSVRGAEGAACVVSGVRVDPNRALEGGLAAAVGEQVLLRAASTLTLHTAYRHASSCLLNEIGSNSLEDKVLPPKPASAVGEGDDPLSSTPDSNQVDMLDAMVTQGRLRQLLHQSMSADKKVARDGKVKITEFLKNGNTLLPITADEMRQHSQSDHFVPAATPASADDAASAGSSGGSSDDNLIEYQEFVDAGQIQRVAAAVNGLDVAFRWMGRLGELAHGIRSNREDSAPAVQTIDLSGDNAVFLGGSCGGTNWRTDVVIPLLEAVGVSYYNPQRDDWTPELVTTEANVKETAMILMFVIESSTRALVSVLESVEHICRGRRCFIVMKEMGETPLDFDGKGCTASQGEMDDLRRLRRYLKDVAIRHGVPIFSSCEVAAQAICSMHKISSRSRSEGSFSASARTSPAKGSICKARTPSQP